MHTIFYFKVTQFFLFIISVRGSKKNKVKYLLKSFFLKFPYSQYNILKYFQILFYVLAAQLGFTRVNLGRLPDKIETFLKAAFLLNLLNVPNQSF